MHARRTWCEVAVTRSRSMTMIVSEDAHCLNDVWQIRRADIGSGSKFLPTAPAFYIYTPPLGGFPSEYCYAVWHGKLEWCGYPTVKSVEDMFIRFDMIYERDRHAHKQTHRQTPHDSKSRACIASRGKNLIKTVSDISLATYGVNIFSFSSFRSGFNFFVPTA